MCGKMIPMWLFILFWIVVGEQSQRSPRGDEGTLLTDEVITVRYRGVTLSGSWKSS